tara:strand:+ start:704 stop:961 length:258 start_codon:yes stop_codon:yes gene_type:complete
MSDSIPITPWLCTVLPDLTKLNSMELEEQWQKTSDSIRIATHAGLKCKADVTRDHFIAIVEMCQGDQSIIQAEITKRVRKRARLV